jgi:uncharacterized protein
MDIIRFKDAKVTDWSGGKTHELLIYPIGSDFKSGNYDLRISVATVNHESTVFTPLQGVSRTLTVLEGNLTLIHEIEPGNVHEVHLSPYQQDSFQGDERTRSKGKVKDFNVMWKSGDATVKYSSFSPNTPFSLEGKDDVSLVFLAKGSFSFDGKTVQANDVVVIHGTLELRTIEQCEIIKVAFNY